MTEIIFHVSEAPEGGYTAKAVGQSIFTEADSLNELKAMIRDAVLCHFEDDDMPKVVRIILTREELFPMAA